MTRVDHKLRDYMTSEPHSIGKDQTLSAAHELMRAHNIRHLPVLHGGRLAGLLSMRDLLLIETLPDVDPTSIRVEEAMTQDIYTAGPDEPLAQVARAMAERKLGSAVAVEHGRVVGVFTTVDALRALSENIDGA